MCHISVSLDGGKTWGQPRYIDLNPPKLSSGRTVVLQTANSSARRRWEVHPEQLPACSGRVVQAGDRFETMETLMNDKLTKMECLKLAAQSGPPHNILDRAASYYDFVIGGAPEGHKRLQTGTSDTARE